MLNYGVNSLLVLRKIPPLYSGAVIHIVEIDPLVISASIQAMGFPAFSVMTSFDQRALSKPSIIDQVMWRGLHERLRLYESDAETNSVHSHVYLTAENLG